MPLCKLEVHLEGYKNGAVKKGCDRPDVQEYYVAKGMLGSLSSPNRKVKGQRVLFSLPLTDGRNTNPPAQKLSTQDLFQLKLQFQTRCKKSCYQNFAIIQEIIMNV